MMRLGITIDQDDSLKADLKFLSLCETGVNLYDTFFLCIIVQEMYKSQMNFPILLFLNGHMHKERRDQQLHQKRTKPCRLTAGHQDINSRESEIVLSIENIINVFGVCL